MRIWTKRYTSQELNIITRSDTSQLRGRLLRAEACSANGFEALPLYAAAVTAGNAAGLSALTMNMLSIGWLLSRAIYTYVYIWQCGT
nr:hypothetical protein [Tanacetum cinerariifolium]